MGLIKTDQNLNQKMRDYLLQDFDPMSAGHKEDTKSEPKWEKMHEAGTELWVDSGNIGEIEKVWTSEFSAVTVNNTLLNKEIQSGGYDELTKKIAGILGQFGLDEKEKILEINFALNVFHGLRLVEKFDCYVSLEEHTDLAFDVDRAVEYGKRIYRVCPQKFLIKVPFTAAGLLATRKLSAIGVPVNHTLGFSARQNYLMARVAQPAYVNVFLGRLNSFVGNNELGSGEYVGEKATLASQRAIDKLHAERVTSSRQIGASFRSGIQVVDLAGINVMTMPPKVTKEFLDLNLKDKDIVDKTNEDYKVGVNGNVDWGQIRLATLWDVDEKLVKCVDDLESENIDSFTPGDLFGFFREHDCGDVLVEWSDAEMDKSYTEGKIPMVKNWADDLESGRVGLDSLMNLAGLNSFRKDQDAMDERIKEVIK